LEIDAFLRGFLEYHLDGVLPSRRLAVNVGPDS
jgi:hypothetical protein